jgi:uncharacterized repeat protein (TIGR01451 family)
LVPNPVVLGLNGNPTTLNIQSGGHLTISGASNVINGATLTLASGGNLTNNGNLTLDGAFTFGGGLLDGSGTIAVTASTGSFTFNGASGAMTMAGGQTIDNFRNLSVSGANPVVMNGSRILNESGAVMTLTNSAINGAGGAELISNLGTINASGASGSVNVVLNNKGTISTPATGDSLGLKAGGTHTGTFAFGAASNQFSFSSITTPHQFDPSAKFTGTGAVSILGGSFLVNEPLTIPANVTNSGSLKFGPGGTQTLTINGTYVQNAAGALTVRLNSPALFDQVIVNGTNTLNGTLNATLGYVPANNQTWNIMTDTAVSGDFAPKNLPSYPNGVIKEVPSPPSGTQVTLQAVPQADIAISKMGPAGVLDGQNATFTVKVANLGPATPATVTITDSFTGGTFVSATPTSGTCSGTGPITCSSLSVALGTPELVTVVLAAKGVGTLTNTASLSSSAPADPNPANDNASFTTAVNPAADLTGTVSAATNPVNGGQNETWQVVIINNGPDAASNVVVNLALTGGTMTMPMGPGFTCTLNPPASAQCTNPSIAAGMNPTITVTSTAPNVTGLWTLNVNVNSSTADPNTINNKFSGSVNVGACPSAPTSPSPSDGAFDVAASGSLTWTDAGATSYNVYLGKVGNGCSQAIGNVTGTSMPYALQQGTQYEWRVESVTAGCPVLSTPCMKFTTINTCSNTPPTLVAPTNGSTVTSPVTFTWTAVGAVNYRVFASVGGATPTEVGATTGTSLTANIGDGAVTWYVVAEFPSPCVSVQSATGTFNTCTGAAPIPSLVSEIFTNQTYTLAWKVITGAPQYEVDEALDKNFTQSRSTQTVSTTSALFQHTVTVPTAFFYRVRAFIPCRNSFGPNSETMRIVLALVPSPTAPNPNVNVPAGSNRVVVQIVHIPGFPDGSFPFSASVDKPWLQVTPASFTLPPEGIDLTVTADPTTLPNGTQTGTVIVTPTSSSGLIRSNGVTPVSVPVSITLVTPVSPITKTLPPANTLIIPSAGHLDGINSRWQSDIRIANVSTQSARFQLTLTPDDVAKGVKQTVITADAGATIALDDIVRNWYGIGSLGEQANGILEIRPLDAVNAVASSRTYNLTSNGTLGQFIPAVRFSKFIGKVTDPNTLAPVLGMQQIAQNPDYRTNFGMVEG